MIQDQLEQAAIEFLVVSRQVSLDQLLLMHSPQGPNREPYVASFIQDLAGLAGQGAGYYNDSSGQLFREPRQGFLIIRIKPVQAIQNPYPSPALLFAPAPQAPQRFSHLRHQLPPILRHLQRISDLLLLQQQQRSGVDQPPQQGPHRAGVVGASQVVGVHQILRGTLLVGLQPVGNQGALAGAGFTRDQDSLLALFNPALQLRDRCFPTQVQPRSGPPVIAVALLLLLQRILGLLLRMLPLDHSPQIRLDPLGDRLWCCQALGHREATTTHLLLEGRQPLPLLQVVCHPARFRLGLGIGRIAQIEEGMPCHLRIAQHTMQDFQLREAGAAHALLQPGLSFQQGRLVIGGIGRRHPAIALAEQADEIGPATINLRQTQRQRFSAFGLIGGHTPAQIHIYDFHTA